MADAICVVEDNVEATEAWNGRLVDVWIRYRDIVVAGLRDHARRRSRDPPSECDRVLDSGWGLGDTTQRTADLVPPSAPGDCSCFASFYCRYRSPSLGPTR